MSIMLCELCICCVCTYAFYQNKQGCGYGTHFIQWRVTNVLAICRQLYHNGINHVTICYKPDYNLQETSLNSILFVALYSGCRKVMKRFVRETPVSKISDAYKARCRILGTVHLLARLTLACISDSRPRTLICNLNVSVGGFLAYRSLSCSDSAVIGNLAHFGQKESRRMTP